MADVTAVESPTRAESGVLGLIFDIFWAIWDNSQQNILGGINEAAILVGKRCVAHGIKKRALCSKRPLKSISERLGIIDVEKEIQSCD